MKPGDWGFGMDGCGHFGGSAAPRYETASSPIAPAGTRHCFFHGHADVAVTYKQSISEVAGAMRERGKERAAQGRAHAMAWSPLEETETRPRRTNTAPFAGLLSSSS